MDNTLKHAVKIFFMVVGISLLSFVITIFIGMDDPSIITTSNGTEVTYSSLSTLVGNMTAIVTTILLFLLIYNASWRAGAYDKNTLPLTDATPKAVAGLFSGLFAIIPLFIIVSIAIATKALAWEAISRIFVVAPVFFWYVRLYLKGQFWFAYVYLALIPLVSFWAYWLGMKNYSVYKLIVFKNGHIQDEYVEKTSTMDYLSETNRKNLK